MSKVTPKVVHVHGVRDPVRDLRLNDDLFAATLDGFHRDHQPQVSAPLGKALQGFDLHVPNAFRLILSAGKIPGMNGDNPGAHRRSLLDTLENLANGFFAYAFIARRNVQIPNRAMHRQIQARPLELSDKVFLIIPPEMLRPNFQPRDTRSVRQANHLLQ